MKVWRDGIFTALALTGLFLTGCDRIPGKPSPDSVWRPPGAEKNFRELYRKNCLACHGDGTTISASLPMNNPTYLAVIPREKLREKIARGVPNTLMPAFAQSAGGPLTEEQVDILTDGILAWKKADTAPANPPPYEAPLGDVERGGQVYAVYCASCHGPDGSGGSAGAVNAPAYLGLVSNQYLRTVVIAGRPDLGMPDYQGYVPGRPMTEQEIADVTAWLVSQRKPGPAEPVPPGE